MSQSAIMAVRERIVLLALKVTPVLWIVSLVLNPGSAYKLQDTIYALKDENVYLQHRLDNVTRALRDLKHLVHDRSKVSGEKHEGASLHAWNNWVQHGVSAETYLLLEQAFCLPDPRGASSPCSNVPPVLLVLLVLWMLILFYLALL